MIGRFMKNKSVGMYLLGTFLLLLIMVPLAFSWVTRVDETPITVKTGEYVITLNISFGENRVNIGSEYYDAVKKVVIVNAYDPLAPNYIGNLRISFALTPHIASRIRIKIQDEWQLTREYYGSGLIIKEVIFYNPDALGFRTFPFDLSLDFTGKSVIDGYYYYSDVLLKEEPVVMDFIVGGTEYPVRSNDVFFEKMHVELDLIFDIVQANRFHEIWGLPVDFFDTP